MGEAKRKGKAKALPYYATGGEVLLSMEPGDDDGKWVKNKPLIKNWQKTREHLESRRASLHAWRTSWWLSSWQDLSIYLLPRRSLWLTQSPSGQPSPGSMLRGLEINNAIINSTGTQAHETCANGLSGGLASPSRPWFGLTADDDVISQPGVQEYIDEAQTRLYTVLSHSNFYEGWKTLCGDLTAFGTAPMIVYEDADNVARFYNPSVGEYYLASGARDKDNAIYRLFVYTVSQIVDYFGLENCGTEIKNLWAQKGSALDQEFTVGHAIEPNFELDGEGAGKIPGKFTWREIYWLYGKGEENPLSVAGFEDIPFIVARWSQQSNDAYGRGPGQNVICDIKMLQVLERRKAEAIEKVVRPPMVGDIRLKNEPASTIPGDITYADLSGNSPGIRSIYGTEFRPDIAAMTAEITRTEQRIERGFYINLFAMLENLPSGRATAYEIAQRQAEKLGQVGPVFDSMMNNQKDILRRVYGIMKRRGLFPPEPPALIGRVVGVTFISTIALAQRAAATTGIEQILAFLGRVVGLYPEAKDLVDIDEVVREESRFLGNPEKILRSETAVAAIRQRNAQLQEQAQRAQMLTNGGTAAVNAAQTLSQTPVGSGGSALDLVLGQHGLQTGS